VPTAAVSRWSARATSASPRILTPARPHDRAHLFTQAIHKMGDVDDGNTVTDWMDRSAERALRSPPRRLPATGPRRTTAPTRRSLGLPHRSISSTPRARGLYRAKRRALHARVLANRLLSRLFLRRGPACSRNRRLSGGRRQNTKSPANRIRQQMDRHRGQLREVAQDMRKKLARYAYPFSFHRQRKITQRVIDVVNQRAIAIRSERRRRPQNTRSRKYPGGPE